MNDIASLEARRHDLAVEAYKQTDNASWTRMWDECAELARRIAELHRDAGDAEAARSWERIADHNTHNADVFRGRPNGS